MIPFLGFSQRRSFPVMGRGGLSFLLLTNLNRIHYLCDFRGVVARWVYYTMIARSGQVFLSRDRPLWIYKCSPNIAPIIPPTQTGQLMSSTEQRVLSTEPKLLSAKGIAQSVKSFQIAAIRL